jgi:hypothetical protein
VKKSTGKWSPSSSPATLKRGVGVKDSDQEFLAQNSNHAYSPECTEGAFSEVRLPP